MIRAFGATIALLLFCTSAHAHKPSDSYLTLQVHGNKIDGQWDIALRDLDFALGLDADGNGAITWDEVRNKHTDIAAYALSRLSLSNQGKPCLAKAEKHLVDGHTDGMYEVLLFSASCETPVASPTIAYMLFFDFDPQHRGLVKLVSPNGTSTAIFSPDTSRQTFTLGGERRLHQFAEYVKNGVWHIWLGFDHILFLLSLLFPAVLHLSGRKWQPAEGFKPSFLDVLKIVTAFTVAHSITLTLATLQVISLPSRLVESAIALSVIVASLNNLFPLFQKSRWIAAFLFGLIHGFGFASVLTDLGLPQSVLLLALVGFNLGVEVGQLAIVGIFLPIAYLLRRTWFYRRVVFNIGSALIAVISAVWLIERAFDMRFISS
jgi:hypothetical protein